MIHLAWKAFFIAPHGNWVSVNTTMFLFHNMCIYDNCWKNFLYRVKLQVPMDFCCSLSGHMRTKHSINSVPTTFLSLQNVKSFGNQNQLLRDRGRKSWDPALTSLFGGTNFPSSPLLWSPAIMLTVWWVPAVKSSLGINNPTLQRPQEAPDNRDRLHWLCRGVFHNPSMSRLFREFPPMS